MAKMTKDALIQIKVSEIEKIYLQKKAERENCSLTEYIMKRTLPERNEILKKYEEQFNRKKQQVLEQFEEEFIKEYEEQVSKEISIITPLPDIRCEGQQPQMIVVKNK